METTHDREKVRVLRFLQALPVAALLLSIANALHPLIHQTFLGRIVDLFTWVDLVLCGIIILIVCLNAHKTGLAWYEYLSPANGPGASAIFAYLLCFIGLLTLKLWRPDLSSMTRVLSWV